MPLQAATLVAFRDTWSVATCITGTSACQMGPASRAKKLGEPSNRDFVAQREICQVYTCHHMLPREAA